MDATACAGGGKTYGKVCEAAGGRIGGHGVVQGMKLEGCLAVKMRWRWPTPQQLEYERSAF
jgi:hypothetical protein